MSSSLKLLRKSIYHKISINAKRELHLACSLLNRTSPALSVYDVNKILRQNEYFHDFKAGSSVKTYESNQLPSNSPCEDSRSEATCIYTSGLLLGIFDGHGGGSCSQVISKRLMRYIAASLVPPDVLRQLLKNGIKSHEFLQCHNDKLEFVDEIKDLYERSFMQYANELVERGDDRFEMHEALENAFLRLDDDMSREATESPSLQTMSVALSGAVSCVAHIDKNHLYVANAGDCQAVLGSINDTGQWIPKKLSFEHNTENIGEVRRILGEHPQSERETVIRSERLLGQLAPLRALGDYRYKWSRSTLEKLVVPKFGENVIAPHYHTPPYLTAMPEVTHHILTPKDKFLVIASDGLWDTLSPLQVIQLVGEHSVGKAFLSPLKLPKQDVTLRELNTMLANRKDGLTKKPLDRSSATHLIRNALGGSEYGIEHNKLAHLLSLPQDIVRLFRDDITLTVLYFDTDYLRNSPA